MIKEKLSLNVASIAFNLCVFMIELMNIVVGRKFDQQDLVWDNMDYVNIYIFLDMI